MLIPLLFPLDHLLYTSSERTEGFHLTYALLLRPQVEWNRLKSLVNLTMRNQTSYTNFIL